MVEKFVYRKETAREISFPLGGIGSGCIGLAGNGQLIDVEIFNRPNKGSHAAFSHFAIKTEDNGKVIDQRVINSDYLQGYSGNYNRANFASFGFGVDRAAMSGVPHFKDCDFIGEFPIATLKFQDDKFPGELMMTAFNPFIPTNEKDSSLPAAFFEFHVKNTNDVDLDYTIAFSQANLYCGREGIHTFTKENGISCIYLTNERYSRDSTEYGDLSIATDAEQTSHQLYWYRGKWFDNIATYWQDFRNHPTFKNRVYEKADDNDHTNAHDVATLAAHVRVPAGKTGKIKFVLSWNKPNFDLYWKAQDCDSNDGCCENNRMWKNYYATQFENSRAGAEYSIRNFVELYELTKLFKDTLFDSTLPPEVLEAVSANLSVIKSPTCLRLEDGSLYGFEGCHCDFGCCEGTCTHVWSYTYAIPFLFPRLERSMRTLEYTKSMDSFGGMSFRLMVPPGAEKWDFRPCVDGQYGTVMRVYREFIISGDVNWLKNIWPQVKKSIEFAWSKENADRWDINRDGVMEGRQHHTLDMELFGQNAWLTGMYLGGLLAGAKLAEILGEQETADEYMEIFTSGKRILNEELFNGEYYFQKIDVKDKSILAGYDVGKSLHNLDVFDAYWNEEQDEIMYQIADGCGLDQVLVQWHANLLGLGEVLEPEKELKAMSSIYQYNFVPNVREHFNPCRIYCLNDEGGLLICTWPDGRDKPFIPLPYAEETQNGYEYAAAIHMIQVGLEEEGLRCIRAIRERYNGEKRNPWNEFECGSNYARSMASYSLLLVYSGFKYNMHERCIGFAPISKRDNFRCFWSLDSGWGQVIYREDGVTIQILYGSLPIKVLELENISPCKVIVDDREILFTFANGRIELLEDHAVNKSITVKY